MFFWADICARLRLVDRACELYELIKPFLRPVSRPRLASCTDRSTRRSARWPRPLERYDDAERHFATAAKAEEQFGAPLLLARTRAGWARALIARGRPEDLDRAQPMLDQAEDTAGRLGAKGITREVAECYAVLAAVSR